MKKLMIAAAIVCAAVASQAAIINWSSSSVPNFLSTGSLSGNGDYAAAGATMKQSGYTFAYTLTVTDSKSASVGSATGTVSYNMVKKFAMTGITVGKDELTPDATYNYVIEITTDLAKVGKQGDWDYKNATATTILSGTFKGSTGSSAIESGVPSTWTVAGATKEEPEPTPEPTSAMLMLLGVAGLALRRKAK